MTFVGFERQIAPIFTLRVYGTPAPGGSKTKNRYGAIYDASKRNGPWKNAVAQAAGEKWNSPTPRDLIDLPMHVNLTFFVRRPKSHFNSKGALKPNAPTWPAKKPDATKLARAVEDALTGVVWQDDCLIVTQYHVKRWGDHEGVEIEIAVSSP